MNATPFLRRPAATLAGGEGTGHRLATLVVGIALLLLAGWVLLTAAVAGRSVVQLMGALLIFGGGIELLHAFLGRHQRRGWPRVLLGALTVLVGVLFLLRPVVGLAAASLAFASYLMASGLVLTVASLRLREEGWGFDLFVGAVSWCLGVWMAFAWPAISVWALGALVSAELALRGVAMIGAALRPPKIAATA